MLHDASESIRKIKYPMLADPTGLLSRAFGVMIEEEGVAYRGTFVVNPEGKVKLAEIQDNSIGRNADELLRKVEAAQFVATHDHSTTDYREVGTPFCFIYQLVPKRKIKIYSFKDLRSHHDGYHT